MRITLLLLALMAGSATAGCVYHHEVKQPPEPQREWRPASLDHHLAALPEARS